MIWLHNLYQHPISIHVSSGVYSRYKNTWLVSAKPRSKTNILFLRLYSWKTEMELIYRVDNYTFFKVGGSQSLR